MSAVLVAVPVGLLDTAVPYLMFDICAAEDDEAGLQLLRIDNEGHGTPPTVQELCVFRA
jgi:hypothetical protein